MNNVKNLADGLSNVYTNLLVYSGFIQIQALYLVQFPARVVMNVRGKTMRIVITGRNTTVFGFTGPKRREIKK